MPVTFTPEELVNAYSQRQNQLRQEALGNTLRQAEVKLDPSITGKDQTDALAEITRVLKVIDNAYDAVTPLLAKAQSDLDKTATRDTETAKV